MIIREPGKNLLGCNILFELQSQDAAHPIIVCKDWAITMLFLITTVLITAINTKKAGWTKEVGANFFLNEFDTTVD